MLNTQQVTRSTGRAAPEVMVTKLGVVCQRAPESQIPAGVTRTRSTQRPKFPEVSEDSEYNNRVPNSQKVPRTRTYSSRQSQIPDPFRKDSTLNVLYSTFGACGIEGPTEP